MVYGFSFTQDAQIKCVCWFWCLCGLWHNLKPHDCWDCRFESCWRHGCLSLVKKTCFSIFKPIFTYTSSLLSHISCLQCLPSSHKQTLSVASSHLPSTTKSFWMHKMPWHTQAVSTEAAGLQCLTLFSTSLA